MSLRTLSQQKLSGKIYNSTKTIGLKGSVAFDGSGDYLTVSANTAFDFGTSDFTVEAFVKLNALSGGIVSTYSGWWLQHRSDQGGFCFGLYDAFTLVRSYSTLSTWVHVAVSRSGTDMRMFFDGVQQGATLTNSTNFSSSSNDLRVGTLTTGAINLNGNVSNLRIVKGTALYTANFTKPLIPLTAVTGTSLLTCQHPDQIIDRSSNAFTVTASGNAAASSSGPS